LGVHGNQFRIDLPNSKRSRFGFRVAKTKVSEVLSLDVDWCVVHDLVQSQFTGAGKRLFNASSAAVLGHFKVEISSFCLDRVCSIFAWTRRICLSPKG
jgi:hypothetical protein